MDDSPAPVRLLKRYESCIDDMCHPVTYSKEVYGWVMTHQPQCLCLTEEGTAQRLLTPACSSCLTSCCPAQTGCLACVCYLSQSGCLACECSASSLHSLYTKEKLMCCHRLGRLAEPVWPTCMCGLVVRHQTMVFSSELKEEV